MALTVLIGRPGSGKTYTLVEKFLLPALKQGRPVVHNIPGLKTDEHPLLVRGREEGLLLPYGALSARVNIPDTVILNAEGREGDFSFRVSAGVREGEARIWPRGALLIVDEYYLATRDFDKMDQMKFHGFVMAHRHFTSDKFGFDIVLSGQHDVNLPRELVMATEVTIHCRPDRLWPGRLERYGFDGPRSVNRSQPSEAVWRQSYKPKKAVYSLYHSYAGSVPVQGDRGKTLTYFFRFKLFAGFTAFAIALTMWLWWDWFKLFGWIGGDPPRAVRSVPVISSPVVEGEYGRGCFFIHGQESGYILEGDCDYPESSPLPPESMRRVGNSFPR